jgi:Bor protein
MHRRRWLPLALCVALSTGCYRQVVHTSLAPSNRAVEHWFVSIWAWGLIPAKPIDVRRECTGGVATIMAEQSRANVFIAILTVGIYTPMHVRVTCAAEPITAPRRPDDVTIPSGASEDESAEILLRAVERVSETGTPVVVRF